MRKEAVVPERCQTIAVMQRIIGGKWKLEILYYIGFENVHRFGGLRRHIGGISESSLTTQLRELEADGFIHRHDYKEIPPKVEYSLTELGKSFMPVMEYLKAWGEENDSYKEGSVDYRAFSLGFPVMWVILCEEPGLSMDGMGNGWCGNECSSGVEVYVAMGAEAYTQ